MELHRVFPREISPIYSLQIGKILDTEERIPPRSSAANQVSFTGLLMGRAMAGSKACIAVKSPAP